MILDKIQIGPGLFRRALPHEIPTPVQCRGCPGKVMIKNPSPNLFSDVTDPLPIPELNPLPKDWAEDKQIIDKHIKALSWLSNTIIPPPEKAEGEGIVIVGGGKFWAMICTAVRMIRDVSNLPIQIWYRGFFEPIDTTDLEGIENISYHDSSAIPHRKLGGWEAKSVALINCGFSKVLYLDADAYVVDDPQPLLNLATEDNPFVYWLDFDSHKSDIKWEKYGLTDNNVPIVQGGQLAINRKAFWRQLVIFHWLNQHSDYFYRNSFGDQSQWSIVLRATNCQYNNLGYAPWVHPAFVCNLNNKPLIVHRTQSKLFLPKPNRTTHLPGDLRLWKHWEKFLNAPAEKVFTRIYQTAHWGHGDRSGGGSTEYESKPYINIINGLIKLSGAQTVVDLACGDGFITNQLKAPEIVGVDVYKPHLNRLKNESPNIKWINIDIEKDKEQLPEGDLCLIKDVLHHWPNEMITRWASWIKNSKKYKWIIICSDAKSPHSNDINLGESRPLDENIYPLLGLGFEKLMDFNHKRIWLLC